MIFPGRYTVKADEDFVVFLIGMRINRPLAVHKWFPVFVAMPRMIKWLRDHPQDGLIDARYAMFASGAPLVIQYWRTFEQLDRFASAKEPPHLDAWRAFRKAIGDDGSVGIWHETYRVGPGQYEAIYGNMPRVGLALVGDHVPVGSTTSRAAARMGS